MKKFLLPGTALVALLVAVLGGAVALGAFDGDDDGGSRDAVADEAKCAADGTDCEEPGGDDIFGICISEDDPAYNPDEPCEDTEGGDTDGSALGMCAPGVTDCVDMVVNDGGDAAQSCLAGATDCDDTPTGEDDPAVRIYEIVITDMETNVGSVATIVSAEYVDWPDSCLGVETEGVACAQVITPGFKIVVEAGGQQVEYHTDMAGGFTTVN